MIQTASRRDGRTYRYKVVGTNVVGALRSVTDAEIVDGRLIISFSDGTKDDTGLVGSTVVGQIPENALVSRVTGQLLASPISGDQLVGVNTQ